MTAHANRQTRQRKTWSVRWITDFVLAFAPLLLCNYVSQGNEVKAGLGVYSNYFFVSFDPCAH